MTIQSQIHSLAVECLEDAASKDGDFTMLSKLYNALPAIVRRNTFISWSQAFAPCRFTHKKTKDGKTVKLFKKASGDTANPYDIPTAQATLIQNYEAETQEPSVLTCESIDTKVSKYLAKIQKEAVRSGDVKVQKHIKDLIDSLDI